ncbi:MAG TPA: hypothetical protein DDX71_01175, partial [Ruminococcus sp.]|nr:hypothetical protein [Ruminococcus sp.]
MKSFFKRTLASATGTALILSQAAAVAVNITANAADDKPIIVDKQFLLNVPIDPDQPLKGLVPGDEELGLPEITRAGDELNSVADASLVMHSDWAELAETKLAMLTEDKADVSATVSSAKVKEAFKNHAMRYIEKYASEATVDELLAKAGEEVTATIDKDGKAVIELEIAEAGPNVGYHLIEKLDKGDYLNLAGITVDWSNFSIKGTAIINAQVNFADKSVSYEVAFKAEDGKTYVGKDIETYARAKEDEAFAIIANAGSEIPGFAEKVDEAKATINTKVGYIQTMLDSIEKVDQNYGPVNDLEGAYASFKSAVNNKIMTSGVPEPVAKRVAAWFKEKYPATVAGVFTNETVVNGFDTLKDAANKQLSKRGRADKIDLAITDVAAIVNDGYDYYVNFDKGYAAELAFSYQDDEADALFTAINDKYADIWAAEQKQLDTVTSHKEIIMKVDTDYLVTGEYSFDVIRVIDSYTLKELETTTSETSTTTNTTETVSTETNTGSS